MGSDTIKTLWWYLRGCRRTISRTNARTKTSFPMRGSPNTPAAPRSSIISNRMPFLVRFSAPHYLTFLLSAATSTPNDGRAGIALLRQDLKMTRLHKMGQYSSSKRHQMFRPRANDRVSGDSCVQCHQTSRKLHREAEQIDIGQCAGGQHDFWVEHSGSCQ